MNFVIIDIIFDLVFMEMLWAVKIKSLKKRGKTLLSEILPK